MMIILEATNTQVVSSALSKKNERNTNEFSLWKILIDYLIIKLKKN
jgi:hypothetical protein